MTYTIPRQKHMDKLSHSNRKFSVTWNLVELGILFKKLFHFPEFFIPQRDATVYTQSTGTSSVFINWQQIYPTGNRHSFKLEAFHLRPDTATQQECIISYSRIGADNSINSTKQLVSRMWSCHNWIMIFKVGGHLQALS